jgi:hypothetical protein
MKEEMVIKGNQGFFVVALGFSACTTHFKEAVFNSFHEKAQYGVEMGEHTGYIRIDCTDIKANCSHGSFVEAVRNSLLDMVTTAVPSRIKGELADEAEVVMDGYKFHFKIVQYERDGEHGWKIIKPSGLKNIPNKEKLGRVMDMVVTIDEPAPDQSQDEIVLDKKSFFKVLETQCRDSKWLPGQVWGLAENVFAAMMRPNNGQMDWRVNFYFDDREIKVRDEESNAQQMDPEIRRQMLKGFAVAALSVEHETHIRVAYFEEDPTGCNLDIVLNCATNLFVRTDNSEVAWLDEAEVLPFSMIGR